MTAQPRRYRALLVGNWHFPHGRESLPDLRGPLNDVSRLAEVLTDPQQGLFLPENVAVLAERESRVVLAEIEEFFGRAVRDDVLLFYYSGHGLTADDDGSLLLCARDSRAEAKLASTVSSESINRMISLSPASAVIIILDCCYAGAFKSGELSGDLAGRGRFVLASSRPRDRARDADDATGMSRFTAKMVEGIRSDHVTLSDLYGYLYAAAEARQLAVPQRRFDGSGDIALARRQRADAVVESDITLSKSSIEVSDCQPGQELPRERVFVRGSSGWQVMTDAAWVELGQADDHFVVGFRPMPPGAHRANVDIYEPRSGRHLRLPITVQVGASPRSTSLRSFGRVGMWALAIAAGFFVPFVAAMTLEAVAGMSTVAGQLGSGIFGSIFFGGLFYLGVWLLTRSLRTSAVCLIATIALGLTVEGIAVAIRHPLWGTTGLVASLGALVLSAVWLTRLYRGRSARAAR